MSEFDIETPEADAAEQRTEVFGDHEASEDLREVPLTVNEADAVEQHQAVELDEDDYR